MAVNPRIRQAIIAELNMSRRTNSRSPVPGAVTAAEPGHELEGPEEDVDGGTEDVEHDRQWEGGESFVGRDELGAAGELDQPQTPDDQRDGGQGGQGGRDRPARSRTLLPGPMLSRHRPVTMRSSMPAL